MGLIDRGPFRRTALRSYISQMSTPNPKGLFDDLVASVLEEQGFSWDENPRSVYEPEQLYTALERYATDWTQFERLDSSMKQGFVMAFKTFARPKGSPFFRMPDSVELVKALKLSKSSGLPLMTSKAKSLVYSLDREEQIRSGIKAPNPCVAYKRTQKNNKTRLVWGYPLEMTIMEARFARSLIDHFKKHTSPMAFGLTKVALGARIHRNFEDQPGTTVCLDFSKFDSTISQTMIRQAFRILGTWFTEEDKAKYGWKTVIEYFIHTPIVMPDGHLYTGKNHGVPSGSYFTQIIDSIVNVAMMYALQYSCGMQFRSESLLVLGDDVIVQLKGQVELKRYSDYLASAGLNLHGEEKTVVGECHFLGATWIKGKPHRPVKELVESAIFPESFRNYGGDKVKGPKAVLRSYASSYIEGIALVPTKGRLPSQSMRWIDHPVDHQVDQDSRYMTGSEKFFFEEFNKALDRNSRYYDPTLSLRILL